MKISYRKLRWLRQDPWDEGSSLYEKLRWFEAETYGKWSHKFVGAIENYESKCYISGRDEENPRRLPAQRNGDVGSPESGDVKDS
ncbi:hypothetical protein HHK36_007832 [Tetracentron sinense]|uniref:Uncharacterized protein n=1 Tax=Tetracentron sinense TaxID=13715 RepID=A0A834ZEJ1_TETSI|nr:hypothetical protein HHK36_007832 [Tetracentron sinense]